MAAPDLTTLSTAINFSTTTKAILAVAVSIIVLVIIITAYLHIRSMITGKIYFAGQYWDKEIYKKGIEEVHLKISRGELVDKESRDAWMRYTGNTDRRKIHSVNRSQRRKRIF